jgi:hypothetical protein
MCMLKTKCFAVKWLHRTCCFHTHGAATFAVYFSAFLALSYCQHFQLVQSVFTDAVSHYGIIIMYVVDNIQLIPGNLSHAIITITSVMEETLLYE